MGGVNRYDGTRESTGFGLEEMRITMAIEEPKKPDPKAPEGIIGQTGGRPGGAVS